MHHHGAGLRRILTAKKVDEAEQEALVGALGADYRTADLSTADRTMLDYVTKLTRTPGDMSAEDVVESLSDFEFFTDFGEAFQYSNQMVATGGYLSSLAAGGEYGDLHGDYVALMQDSIIDNIGMDDTTFSFEEVVGDDNYAMPYGRLLTGEMVELPLSIEEVLIPIGPAGAADFGTGLSLEEIRHGDSSQNSDYSHDDQQFDQRKSLLLVSLLSHPHSPRKRVVRETPKEKKTNLPLMVCISKRYRMSPSRFACLF